MSAAAQISWDDEKDKQPQGGRIPAQQAAPAGGRGAPSTAPQIQWDDTGATPPPTLMSRIEGGVGRGLGNLGQGLVNTVKLGSELTDLGTPKPILTGMLEGSANEFGKARDAMHDPYLQGAPVSKALAVGGHALAGALPGVGPWAANLGETIGKNAATPGGDVAGPVAEAATTLGAPYALKGLGELGAGTMDAVNSSKLGRSFINESAGARGADVTYGNPAKALKDIPSPFTGDFEKLKDTGNAGGRLGAVTQKINTLSPQLDQALQRSPARISVADAIDKPINDALQQIRSNPAMTAAEKSAAANQLTELQKSLRPRGQGAIPGAGAVRADMTPAEAVAIKRAIGDRVRWGGESAVGDEVKPVYRSVYNSLNQAVHNAVPEASGLDSQLTDLFAAKDALTREAKMEEVSRGSGPLRATTGRTLLGALESGAGRGMPLAAQTAKLGVAGLGRATPFMLGGPRQVQ